MWDPSVLDKRPFVGDAVVVVVVVTVVEFSCWCCWWLWWWWKKELNWLSLESIFWLDLCCHGWRCKFFYFFILNIIYFCNNNNNNNDRKQLYLLLYYLVRSVAWLGSSQVSILWFCFLFESHNLTYLFTTPIPHNPFFV